jgi:hypothetical protein
MEIGCWPKGWPCYLRAPEKSVKAEALPIRLKYTATLGEDATKSLGARPSLSQCEIYCSKRWYPPPRGAMEKIQIMAPRT